MPTFPKQEAVEETAISQPLQASVTSRLPTLTSQLSTEPSKDVTRHYANNVSTENYQCPKCEKCICSRCDQNRFMLQGLCPVCVPRQTPILSTSKCKGIFNRKCDLVRHLKSAHMKDADFVEFTQRLLGHKIRVVEYCCNELLKNGERCGYTTTRSGFLTTHQKIHLQKEHREYACLYYKQINKLVSLNGLVQESAEPTRVPCNPRSSAASDRERHHMIHTTKGDQKLPDDHPHMLEEARRRDRQASMKKKTRNVNQ